MSKLLIKSLSTGIALSYLLPAVAMAHESSEIEALRQEVKELKELLMSQIKTTKITAKTTTKAIKSIKRDVKKIKPAVAFNEGKSKFRLSGYGSMGYTEQEISDGRFNQVQFAPIIQYSYDDKVFFVSELDYSIAADGTTAVDLEYATTNVVLNDNATFVVGKFLSPLGSFRQNGHPTWINKLASAPAGFGHDQAAPVADVGVQLRGGFNIGKLKTTYAVYMANGPELELNGSEIEQIESGGFTRDTDGQKVYGGRVTVLPFDNFEIGFSGATGSVGLANEEDRTYNAVGSDFSYRLKGVELRGEILSQQVGSLASSAATDGGRWRASYLQTSYKIPKTKYEVVARYGDYKSPNADQSQSQVAFGVNYLFSSNIIAKLSYELNNGLADTTTDSDRYIIQMAYGF